MNESGDVLYKDDSACFVCGRNNPIGLQVVFQTDPAENTSYARLTLAPEYQGWQGVVHGGILATLLDEACVYACRNLADQCVTAEMQVRYRKPVPVGAEVELFGQLLEHKRKIWTACAQVKVDGTLYAEAQAKVFVRDKQ